MAVELVYETHAITTDNEIGIATGWLPGRLSEAGRAAAHRLGERRLHDGIATVYTSDLARAVETAQIAFDRTGIPVRRDLRLRECNYGALNGAPVTKLAAQRRRRIREPFPDGESCQQVVDRTRDFLTDLVRDRDGHRVLVIAHSASRWALEVLILGKALDDLVDAPFAWQPGWHYLVSSSGFGVRQEGGGV